MITIFPAWLLVQAAEILGWFGVYKTYSRAKQREILLHGKRQPRRIPILDAKLQTFIGPTTAKERLVGRACIASIRKLVDTRAFEHLVMISINRKSKLYSQEKTLCLPRALHLPKANGG